MRPLSMFLASLCFAACKDPEPAADGDPDSKTTPEPSEETSSTGHTGTTPTGDTGPEVVTFDCSSIPAQPTSKTEIPGASGYHDVAFTEGGLIIGNNQGNFHLSTAAYGEPGSVFVPGIGTVQQMVFLPGGDLAVASDNNGIVRVAPNGGQQVIAPDVYAYGLILGPDDLLYAADQSRIQRVDPDTGERDVILPVGALPQGSPRVIQFNLDYTQMYIGTYSGSQGRIYVVDLDETYTPTGEVRELADGVGTGAYHDGLGIDICGYLYVPDYSTSALYRISPSGQQVQNIHNSGVFGADYGHGLEWGNGVGGWRTDAIYLPLPYGGNKVLEVVIGVPSREIEGVVAINLP